MRSLILSIAFAALGAAPALAHPAVLSSTPAAGASVAPTAKIEIKFSEKLIAAMAGASLDMTDMPGMKMHAAMKMKVTTAVSAGGTTLLVTAPKPLPKGGYKLSYHVVSADTHRVEGELAFTVQ